MPAQPATFSHLNPEQLKAVNHMKGPLLIVAGAGTGKTTVIVDKIRSIISQNLAKPEEILALTFTEKASREMEERVDTSMPYGYFQMWISTFHSFADEILRSEITHIGLNPGYKLLTQAETILFLRSHLFLFELKYFRPLGNPHKFLDAMLQHFSRLRDEDVDPATYLRWVKKNADEDQEKNLELAKAYQTYQDLKIKEGYFDFADLLFYLLKLFRTRPSILKKYQNQFKYILVDEFQDTNIAQYLLVKLLAPPESECNLTVVGDDSQAIYKFRGASISNILTFMKDYPQAAQITLNTNYRSYQGILNASHKLIQHNNPDTLEVKLGISKKLISSRGTKSENVHFYIADNVESETEHVCHTILNLKQKNNYRFADFALLVRANNHADAFLTAFSRYGIPYRFLGPGMLFKQPEVKDLVCYLKVLYNLEDSVALYRVLSMDLFNLDPRDLNLLLAFSKKTTLPLFQSIEMYLNPMDQPVYKNFIPLLSEQTKITLTTLMQMIKRHLALVKKESAGQILYYFLEDTDYLKKLVNYRTEREEKISLNITKFFNKLKKFEVEHEDASVSAVVDFLDMSMELGESPSAEEVDSIAYDGVNIMTVHSAKGLEFSVVFLVNLTRGRFPTYEKKETIPIPTDLIKEILPSGDYHLQEERRLFYVGLTRAKDYAFITVAKTYGEKKRERKISPFVMETIGEEEFKKFESLKQEEKQQLSIFDFKKPLQEELIKERIPLTNFSFSQLETFTVCPLQYKYQYVLKIPTSPSSAISFGTSIHKSLQRFYEEFLINKSIGIERLLEIYRASWTPIGYSSASHQERMKKEGKEMLKKYFTTYHDGKTPIIGLEKLFKIRFGENTFITGKIDRVNQTADGGIEIVDYKTGKKPDDKELKKSLQLSMYALAATDKGLYGKELDKVTLTFYYLQGMEKISMKRTTHEIEEVKDSVAKTIEEIRTSTFTPKVGPWCNFCSYKLICEAW